MKLEVVNEKQNPLLKRREVIVNLDYDGKGTLSKADIQKIIADQFKVSVDNVEVSKILSELGISRGKAWIKIWEEKKVPIYSETKKEKVAKPKEEPKKEEPKKE